MASSKKPLLDHVRTENTGVELSYLDWGGSGPPIVLLHGFGSTHRIWTLAAPLLAERFHVIAYDQRGHGFSEKPDEGYDLSTMRDDLRGLIEVLELERPYVVGHSWGGAIALAYAGAYPQECPGIALVDGGLVQIRDIPAVDSWETMSELMAPTDISTHKLSNLARKTRKRGLSYAPRGLIPGFLRGMIAEMPDGTLANRLNPEHHMHILRTIWDTQPEELLAAVQCPTLVITAIPPIKSPAQEAYNTAKLLGVARAERHLTNYKAVLMPDTIHDIPLQRPQELAGEIIEYFARDSADLETG